MVLGLGLDSLKMASWTSLDLVIATIPFKTSVQLFSTNRVKVVMAHKRYCVEVNFECVFHPDATADNNQIATRSCTSLWSCCDVVGVGESGDLCIGLMYPPTPPSPCRNQWWWLWFSAVSTIQISMCGVNNRQYLFFKALWMGGEWQQVGLEYLCVASWKRCEIKLLYIPFFLTPLDIFGV